MNKFIAALALASAVAGCSDPPPPVEPLKPAVVPPPIPAAKPTPPKPQLATPLSDAQKAAIKKAFDEADALGKQADKFKAEGDQIERAQGRQAANDTLVKAKDLYREACALTEDWIEPDLGKVTEAQVKDYMSSYVDKVGRWQKAIAEIGKVHKD